MAIAAIPEVIGVTLTGTVTQWAAVTATGVIATAAGNAVGFAQTGGVTGQRVGVAMGGTSIAIASAAIAIGAALEVVGAAGQVVTKSAGVTVARALTAAASAGDQIEVLVIPN
jgi:hypothetical protein